MIIVLMGVSGSGKTTIGEKLAATLKWRFFDGDALHSAANRRKMHRGIALTDSDRMPWLRRVRRLIDRCVAERIDAIVACSALKQSYRAAIVGDPLAVRLVYLKGTQELMARRLGRRSGHFMPPALLPSQFAALEEPHDATAIDISGTTAQAVRAIRKALKV